MPVRAFLFYFVESLLHACSKFGVHDIVEIFFEINRDQLPQLGRFKAFSVLFYILALVQSRQYGCKSAGAPYPLVFEQFDQTRLRIFRGRFGKFLFGTEF